ncbi:MAG: type II secretion system GspH family protein [Candidatus Nomurabacteria bacterium]|nr:type II secretion system GspH family protein [Candidatus Nomurabacteria bacterium]
MISRKHQPNLNAEKDSGFTLIETLLVMSILGILVGLGFTVSTQLIADANVHDAQQQIGGLLNEARVRSQYGSESKSWGVRIDNSLATLFAGDSFMSRDPLFDFDMDFPGITTQSIYEIIFEKHTGLAIWTGDIILIGSNATTSLGISDFTINYD